MLSLQNQFSFYTDKRTRFLLFYQKCPAERFHTERSVYFVLEIQFRVEGRERWSRDSLSCEEPFHKSARSIASPWRHLSGPAARLCTIHSTLYTCLHSPADNSRSYFPLVTGGNCLKQIYRKIITLHCHFLVKTHVRICFKYMICFSKMAFKWWTIYESLY